MSPNIALTCQSISPVQVFKNQCEQEWSQMDNKRSLAHDIRHVAQALLSAVETFDIALDGRHIDWCRTLAGHVQAAAHQTIDLLGQMLEDSETDCSVNLECDIAETIDHIVRSLASIANQKGVSLVPQIKDNVRIPVRRIDLQRVLLNLLVNAIEAVECETGHVEISASCKPLGWVLIRIRDNGPGLNRETTNQIPSKLPPGRPGAINRGFGLATVKRIVESYQGFIAIQSESRCGADLSVWLPRQESDSQPLNKAKTAC